MKKLLLALAGLLLSATALLANPGTETDDSVIFRQVDHLETVLYGQSRTGGLLARLSEAEKDLFGRELPGSLAERQAALINFIERGAPEQPSLLCKLGVIEWALESGTSLRREPLVKSVPELESRLDGVAMSDKPLAMRIERILTKLVSEPVSWQEVSLPKSTVIRLELLQDLNPATTKKGDHILAALTRDLVAGNDSLLVAPRGSLVTGVVTKVKKPGVFGQSSQILYTADVLQGLGPDPINLEQGESSKKAAEFEMSHASAAGASILGAAVLGPVGLVGGLFVRGNSKIIPAGTVFYAETAQTATTMGYPVPDGLRPMIKSQFIEGDEGAGDVSSPSSGDTAAPSKTNTVQREVDSL